MTSEHITFTPSAGWPFFARSADLEALISDSLPREHVGGIWSYYGFTAWTAIWSSDASPENDLYLSFAGYPTEVPSYVDGLSVVLSDDQSEHYKQLSSLIHQLITDFGLRADTSATPTPNDRNA